MTILNEAELKANNDAWFTTNGAGLITGANLNTFNIDLIESLQSYPGVISDGLVAGNNITATPTKWTNFTTNDTSPNTIFEADQANSLIKVFEPCLTFITFRFNAQWPANEDLISEIYVNGAPNPITPASVTKEGKGATDPELISVTDIAYVINSAMIAAGPGGAYAEIELFLSSATGPFTLDQIDVLIGAEYNPLSIRTVG